MKRLIAGLPNDPDLANIAAATHLKVLQTRIVVTGCDYVSFSVDSGKQHSCDTFSNMQSSKSDTLLDNDIHILAPFYTLRSMWLHLSQILPSLILRAL
jgi:hypothetical protein